MYNPVGSRYYRKVISVVYIIGESNPLLGVSNTLDNGRFGDTMEAISQVLACDD